MVWPSAVGGTPHPRPGALAAGQPGGQGRALFRRCLGVVLNGDVGAVVGEPVAERDQVVLGGQLGIPELSLPPLVDGRPDRDGAKYGHHENDADGDQDGL